MNEKCEHCSAIIWLTIGRLTIEKCTWKCGRIRFMWLKRNGITVGLLEV